MSRNDMHENLDREEVIHGPSDRKFAYVFACLFLALGAWGAWRGAVWGYVSGAFGVVLAIAGAFAPHWVSPLNRAWLKLGLVLFKVVNPVVMAVLFYGTVLPIGLLMRMFGKDPLHRDFDSAAQSYWVKREPPGPPGESLKNQF